MTQEQQELMQEQLALDTRIARLESSIMTSLNKPGYSHLAIQRMHVQLQAMSLYSQVLRQRLTFDIEAS